MTVEVHDAAGEGGRGCKVAAGLLSAPLSEWPDLTLQSIRLHLASGQVTRRTDVTCCG